MVLFLKYMIISSSQNGLGDVLFLTAVAKALDNPTVQLPTQAKRFSILFDKLAKVEIVGEQDLRPTPDIGGGHYVTRKLRGIFGPPANYMSNRPIVLHSKVENEIWSGEYLKDKINPIIFVPTCSSKWAGVRNLPVEFVHSIFRNYTDRGFTPIVCQSSSNFIETHAKHQLIDLDLSKYICLLRKVGLYVGANTGDEHLATAVGCTTSVFQPTDNQFFQKEEWNYSHPNSIYYSWPASS